MSTLCKCLAVRICCLSLELSGLLYCLHLVLFLLFSGIEMADLLSDRAIVGTAGLILSGKDRTPLYFESVDSVKRSKVKNSS